MTSIKLPNIFTNRILTKSKYNNCRMTVEKKAKFFKIVNCTASVDQVETRIIETPSTLNYVTPHFRAEAEVDVPALGEGEEYTIGWVQAVTDMKFINVYPSGCSSWELQELNSGEVAAVSDADGRRYPWYGVTTECRTITGPCLPSRIKVSMNDNFSPTVSWGVPWPAGHDEPDSLQRVERDQSFKVWLVIKDEVNRTFKALKAYTWRAVINIGIDCSKTCSKRARLLHPKFQAQPQETQDTSIPTSALYSPRANEAQKFVWRMEDFEVVFKVQFNPSFCLLPCQWGQPDDLQVRE